MKTLTFPGCERFTAIRFLPVRPMRRNSKKFRDIKISGMFSGGINLLPFAHPVTFRIVDLLDETIHLVPCDKLGDAIGFITGHRDLQITIMASDEVSIECLDNYFRDEED